MTDFIGLKKTENRILDKQFENVVLEKDWKVSEELKFNKFTVFQHQDGCIHWKLLDNPDKSIFDDEGDEICNCTQFAVEIVHARMVTYIDAELGPFIQVSIREKAEFFNNEEEYKNPDKYSDLIKENINNALLTIYIFMKGYELTLDQNLSFDEYNKIVDENIKKRMEALSGN